MHGNPTSVSTKQERIAALARRSPQMGFTSLAYLMDLEWLREAYRRTRKDAAAGVDGQTAADYERDLEGHLQDLLNRAKSGRYFAPPVRRVRIPKPGADGQTRPIGIPTLEDKVLQRAVVMLLEPIYETDFAECSYGFRPGRSAHDALGALWQGLMDLQGGWVLEVDIRSFFDTLDHGHLRETVRQRVRDGVLQRLVGKWLHAGVLEEGELSYPAAGTPQGGVISPLLANVYLDAVLDRWFADEVQPRLAGRSRLVRYADDFVIVFECESDAHRVMDVLGKRFGKFGLELHPDKTRLVRFERPGRRDPPEDRPGTFEFLGFTHYWGKSRSGARVVKRSTSSSRLTRGLRAIYCWCRQNRHRPVRQQHKTLRQKVQGHYNYYGITGNFHSLASFGRQVRRIWQYWLSRRNRKRQLSWSRYEQLLERYPLPKPVVVHSIYRRAGEAQF